jgi:hypothetical protein
MKWPPQAFAGLKARLACVPAQPLRRSDHVFQPAAARRKILAEAQIAALENADFSALRRRQRDGDRSCH